MKTVNKIYWEQQPSNSMKDIVEAYWFFQPGFQDITTDILVPEGVVDIIFNYGAPYYREAVKDKPENLEYVSNDVIVGQRDCLFGIKWPKNTQLFAIRVNPVKAYRLLHCSMDKITNKVIDIKETPLHPFAINLKQTVFTDFETLVAKADETLADYLLPASPSEDLIDAAIKMINNKCGKISVQTLSNNLNTSRRTLERKFKLLIGLTPKFYIRAKRLHYFFCQRHHSKDTFDSALAAEYYDQSHFIKEFKKFTGETPKTFFESPPEIYEPLLKSLISKFNHS